MSQFTHYFPKPKLGRFPPSLKVLEKLALSNKCFPFQKKKKGAFLLSKK